MRVLRRFDTREWIEDGEARVEFEAVPSGTWVTFSDAQAAIDAANKRATDAERRLALAAAEVKAWRAWAKHPDTYLNDCASMDGVFSTRAATNADPVLAKMIGGG